ncbi:uncharacterized protein LOC110348067 [Heterocephalus glaber]|uniref:Uncharacterized protein LOC110348067 n=1 Tax=Heterocephalus glaber TaxID=10181 RepID=A0AAX6SLI6_HETGA|nr:uncharacterized protein LOC110348067 [Heterocephalus glaber]
MGAAEQTESKPRVNAGLKKSVKNRIIASLRVSLKGLRPRSPNHFEGTRVAWWRRGLVRNAVPVQPPDLGSLPIQPARQPVGSPQAEALHNDAVHPEELERGRHTAGLLPFLPHKGEFKPRSCSCTLLLCPRCLHCGPLDSPAESGNLGAAGRLLLSQGLQLGLGGDAGLLFPSLLPGRQQLPGRGRSREGPHVPWPSLGVPGSLARACAEPLGSEVPGACGPGGVQPARDRGLPGRSARPCPARREKAAREPLAAVPLGESAVCLAALCCAATCNENHGLIDSLVGWLTAMLGIEPGPPEGEVGTAPPSYPSGLFDFCFETGPH